MKTYDILNICTDGTTTRYVMRYDLSMLCYGREIGKIYVKDLISQIHFFQAYIPLENQSGIRKSITKSNDKVLETTYHLHSPSSTFYQKNFLKNTNKIILSSY